MSSAEELVEQLRASTPEAQEVADLIEQRIAANVNSPILKAAENRIQQTWLNNGTPVTTTAAGTQVDPVGLAYFDRVNIIGGAASVNASERRQIDIQAGGGTDCAWDYIVSSCFASLAGFTEGQVFTSLSGCTFIGYSTVQGMATAVSALANNSSAVVLICGGTYNENVTFTGPFGTGQIYIIGAAKKRVNIVGQTSGGATISVPGNGTLTACPFQVESLTLTGHASAASVCFVADVTASTGGFRNVEFATGNNAAAYGFDNDGGAASTRWRFEMCDFTGNGIGIGDRGGGGADVFGNVEFVACRFTCAIAGKFTQDSNVFMDGGVVTGALGFICNDSAISSNFFFNGTYFKNSTASFQCSSTGGFNTLQTIGCNFDQCETAFDISGTSANVARRWHIEGCHFKALDATAKAINDPNGALTRSIILGNGFEGYTSGNEISATVTLTTNVIAHNETDSGATLPDTHTPVGSGSAASSGEAFVTIGNSSTLTAERALTGDTAETFTDGGANSTVTHHSIREIVFVMDGGGSTLATGVRPPVQVPFNCTVNSWNLCGDAAGTCTVDISTATDAATPSFSSIVGAGTKPNVAGPAVCSTATAPASWTSTAITAGQLLQPNLTAVTTFKTLMLALKVTTT